MTHPPRAAIARLRGIGQRPFTLKAMPIYGRDTSWVVAPPLITATSVRKSAQDATHYESVLAAASRELPAALGANLTVGLIEERRSLVGVRLADLLR